MTRVMYVDVFAGAAGDMILGALLDAGLPLDALRTALGSLGVDHALHVATVDRAGVRAIHLTVGEGLEAGSRGGVEQHTQDHSQAHDHKHAHSHGHDSGAKPPGLHASQPHGHHTLGEIAGHIRRSALSESARARALAMFDRLAEAEAAIHQTPIEHVHLHEVGALDSIIDIVGAAFAFEWFGIDDVVVSPLNVGHGTIEIAHGTFPVPAPATLRLLSGVPIFSEGPASELLTPTGALVLTTYARAFGRMPAMRVDRVGYGAGTKEFPGFPNVLRVAIGTREEAVPRPAAERALRIECEIDDMTPQLFGPVSDRLMTAGALDVFLTPIQMKKGRPGTLLTVLAPIGGRDALLSVLFAETTTIGVRFDEVERETLARRWVEVAVGGHIVRIKVAERHGRIVNAMPEFEDCLRVADATSQPVKVIHAQALQAWFDRSRTRPE
jgi:uncharacterized protein (TIGR00299 family) protein